MLKDRAMQMFTELAIVDINGTLSTEDISSLINEEYRWNYELLRELRQYKRIILITGGVHRERTMKAIPPTLNYESLEVKPESTCCQERWKLDYLETVKEPFVMYDDNERVISRVKEIYGSESGILVTNMDGGGYA